MKVKYIAPFAVPSGYARANQDYMAALHAAGVDLTIQPLTDADSADLEPRYGHLLELLTHNTHDYSHVIVSTIPRFCSEFVTGDLEPPKGTKRVALTTWETDRFPTKEAEDLDANFDAIVLPSKFCADALVWAGVPRSKIRIIPHCFDPSFWWWYGAPGPRPSREDRKEPYTFYSIGVWASRKAPIELLKAYFTAFRRSDNVLLKFVAPFIHEDDVKNLIACMGIAIEDLPRVEFTARRLTETELRALHYDSDCYVSLSRGEAWGLGAFEAAIVGNPVIATGFSGWKDYLDDYPGTHYVNYLLTPAIALETDIGVGMGLSGDQNWAEPGVCHAKQIMRDSMRYDWNRRQDRERLVRLYSYETVGQQFKAFLEGM